MIDPRQQESLGRDLITAMSDRQPPVNLPQDRMAPADAIRLLIAQHGGSVARAARSVGMPRETLRDYASGRRRIPGTTGRKLTAAQEINRNILGNVGRSFGRRESMSADREAELRAMGSADTSAGGDGPVRIILAGMVRVAGYGRERKQMKIYDGDLKPVVFAKMVDAYLTGTDSRGMWTQLRDALYEGWTPAPPLDISDTREVRFVG